MINKKQITTSQSLYSTEKIDFKKKIISTITVKSLIRQKIKKNKEIYISSDLERLNKLKNRIQEMSERLSTSENILDKYNN